MFMMKKTHKKEINEIINDLRKAESYIKLIEPFCEIGVKSSQKFIQGYKLVALDYYHPNSSLGISFKVALKKAEETEGDLENKILVFLKDLQMGVSNSFPSKKSKKQITDDLKKVTKVSEYTSPMIKWNHYI